ncbi:MAG: MBL fold metallo-hydrolase, partial [Janthinobacterium lividum]
MIPTTGGPDYPLGDRAPAPGEAIEVAPGLRWWRVPMWGPLKHVNGWLIDDGDDVVAVDTGIAGKASVAAWEALLAGPISGRRIGRVVCTHF